MGDMLREVWVDLDGRDDPVLQDAAGAISCRFLVSSSSVFRRTFRLTPSKVLWIPRLQWSVSGMTAAPVVPPCTNYGLKDSCIELG